MLARGYIQLATDYAVSCGGGGGGPTSGWGRDKDDDDDRWWRKCLAHATAMVRPAKGSAVVVDNMILLSNTYYFIPLFLLY